MSGLLLNQRIAITGASGTLGRAAAAEALSMGASLALIDLKLPEVRPWGDPLVSYHTADLTKEDDTKRCFAEIGHVDALLNIAGGFAMGTPTHETSDAAWDGMFDINVKTMLHCIRNVVPQMIQRGRGRIVNVGSFGARSGQPMMSAYVAAKSSVSRITESMASELKRNGINVNCVLPSIIDTPPNRIAMPDADPTDWVSATDLARVICFLASDHARAIHGASIPVVHLA